MSPNPRIFRCVCSLFSCPNEATQQDLLCDVCRDSHIHWNVLGGLPKLPVRIRFIEEGVPQ